MDIGKYYLYGEGDIQFNLIVDRGGMGLVVERTATQINAAKDLIAEAYSFTIPVKDKIYCLYGPKNQKRRLKQISISKLANEQFVKADIKLSQLIFFTQKTPQIPLVRHDLSKYLVDLQANQLTGVKLVDMLNAYVKPGSQTAHASSQPKMAISSCEIKLKKAK